MFRRCGTRPGYARYSVVAVELRGIVLGDRYRLEKRIAIGGMGQVWLAADQVQGRQVAVKLLRPEYAGHLETLERFRSEAKHARVLSHPHIAQVYDHGHYAFDPSGGDDHALFGGPYLVLEYVDGPSLAEVIEREPLSAEFTRDVLAQAAAGLDAAHRAGLVHRDVKPGNLLLASDGQVKVTDFGIAHSAGSAALTAPGIVMGTALYMAPERIAGRPGSPASDLYSLGIVMYECLSGKPPFRGTSVDVMEAHLHDRLPPLPGWVPGSLCDLVAKLTAKDPVYRLSDAGLLAAHLRERVGAVAISSGPRVARPPEPPSGPPALPRARPPASPPLGYLKLSGPDEPAAASAAAGDVALPAQTRADRTLNLIPGLASRAAARGSGRGAWRQSVAVAVVAVVVAAIGLMTATVGIFRSAPAVDPGRPSVAATISGAAAHVQVPAFHGQSMKTVVGWLRAHRLVPKVAWTNHTRLPTGTVILVTPDGPVPAGATVVVMTAYDSATPPSVNVTGAAASPAPSTCQDSAKGEPRDHGRGSAGMPRRSRPGPVSGSCP